MRVRQLVVLLHCLGGTARTRFFSNVSESDPPFCLLTGKSVDDIRRALCNHFRSLPSQPPRHGKWAHRNCDSHFWRPRSFFLELSHFTHSRSMIRDPSSPADWSLVQVALRCCSRWNLGVELRFKSNHDLAFLRIKCRWKGSASMLPFLMKYLKPTFFGIGSVFLCPM